MWVINSLNVLKVGDMVVKCQSDLIMQDERLTEAYFDIKLRNKMVRKK